MNQTAQRETNLEQVERRERSRIRERDTDAAGRRVDGRSQRRRAIERGGEGSIFPPQVKAHTSFVLSCTQQQHERYVLGGRSTPSWCGTTWNTHSHIAIRP